jgi:hypothetical protein
MDFRAGLHAAAAKLSVVGLSGKATRVAQHGPIFSRLPLASRNIRWTLARFPRNEKYIRLRFSHLQTQATTAHIPGC